MSKDVKVILKILELCLSTIIINYLTINDVL